MKGGGGVWGRAWCAPCAGAVYSVPDTATIELLLKYCFNISTTPVQKSKGSNNKEEEKEDEQ